MGDYYQSPIEQWERQRPYRTVIQIESDNNYYKELRDRGWVQYDRDAILQYCNWYLRYKPNRTLPGILDYVIKHRPPRGAPRSRAIARVERVVMSYWRSPLVRAQLNWHA